MSHTNVTCNTCEPQDPCYKPPVCESPYPVCPPVSCPITLDWRCSKYNHLTPNLQNRLEPFGFSNGTSLEDIVFYLLNNSGNQGGTSCDLVKACINTELNRVNPRSLSSQSAWQAMEIYQKIQLLVDRLSPAGSPQLTITASNLFTATIPVTSVAVDVLVVSSSSQVNAITITRLSGPNTPDVNIATFTPAASVNPAVTITNLVTGTYMYRITATDASGLIQTKDFNVVVNYLNPLLSVTGVNLQLPTTQGTLSSSVTVGSYAIATRVWTFVNGPVIPVIVSPNSANTLVTGLTGAGTYTFLMIVTDTNGVSVSAQALIIVNSVTLFDTELNFITLPIVGSAGVTAKSTVGIDPVMKVRFNLIPQAIGQIQNMTIFDGNVMILQISFPLSYLGQQLQIVKQNGNIANIVFQASNSVVI